MRGGGTLVVKAEDLTIKSIERSEVEERVRVENEVIHFDDYDEYATYTLTLENPTSTKLQVTNINLTNNECVSINTDELESTIVEPNSTKEVTLTLTSNKCNVNQDNTALLSFKSKEYTEDKQEEKEDIVSPNTYGNISVFLVVLFILTAIYISLYIYSKKKPFKYLKLSTIIYLSLLVITTITYTIMTSFSANEEGLSLTFSYTYKPRRVLMRRNCNEEDGCIDDDTFWENWEAKNIYIQNTIEEPTSYEEVYDASMNQDKSILVYKVINQDDDNYYDLYIMVDGEIFTNIDSSNAFYDFECLEELNGIDNLNTSMTENMSWMFGFLYSLEELDLSSFDTSNVTNMAYILGDDTVIKAVGIENFNTSKVRDMSYLFYNYSSDVPLDLSHLDTSKVTNMSGMFANYSSDVPLDLSHLDTSKVTNMSGMFSGYSSSTPLDLSPFNTSNVEDMSQMFSSYSSSSPLDLSNFNTSSVTDMSGMFSSYKSSTSLDLSHLDTTNVINMSWMFDNYKSSQTLDLSNFNTSKVTDMSSMFNSYSSEQQLDLSHLDTSNVTNMSAMFYSWNTTADLDISSMDFMTLPDNIFGNKLETNKIYVANDTVRNLIINGGFPNISASDVIVGSCENGVCHNN